MAATRFGRYLLETFPSIYSLGYDTKGGPPKDVVEGSYFKMTLQVRMHSNDQGCSLAAIYKYAVI